jgi:molybdopterin-biosynthesis enzyme MoeA-like protein
MTPEGLKVAFGVHTAGEQKPVLPGNPDEIKKTFKERIKHLFEKIKNHKKSKHG